MVMIIFNNNSISIMYISESSTFAATPLVLTPFVRNQAMLTARAALFGCFAWLREGRVAFDRGEHRPKRCLSCDLSLKS